MILLSADTSGKHGSVALARGSDGGNCDVLEVVPLAGGTFSAQLVPQVAALLAKHGFTKGDIGGFVVASGPGSFTGLRVGLAAIKALAEILEKPIAAVSLLEAVALASGAQGRVTSLVDAGRGELYVGKYEIDNSSPKLLAEQLFRRDEFLAARPTAKLVTWDKDLAVAAQAAGLTIMVVEPVNAGTIARLGWRRIQAGDTVSPLDVEANYIRRSDAEIFAKSSS
jgi:tRNA threonylcarbamoyladenosine biosynthesis protein TsaB